MRFEPTTLTEHEQAFRDEVRGWLATEPSAFEPTMLGMFGRGGYKPEFSRALGAQGWLGLTIPAELGGQGAGAVARLLLTEELLAAQAPVAAHWVADRQSAPVIASHGSTAQRQRFIPSVVAGQMYFSIGMSEPDSGSDLASVKTTATKTDGGWLVNGTKVWTTLAHKNDWFIVLCRTTPSEAKHEGLSQLLIDLRQPGVTVRVIPTLDGEQDFCEVSLTDVFVPDDLLLGLQGQGWAQVTGELAFERGGPDRYLSAWGLLVALVRQAPSGVEETLGRLCARYRIVRELALSAARALERGEQPANEAAVTKDLGTILEQDTIEAVRLWREEEVRHKAGDEIGDLLASAVMAGPTFTLRGGTTEILRSMVARSAGDSCVRATDDLLGRTVDDILTGKTSRDGTFDEHLWARLAGAGLPWVGIDEGHGGSGGGVRDAATVITAVGAAGAAVPVAETWVIASLCASAGHPITHDPALPAGEVKHSISGEARGAVPSGPWTRDQFNDRLAASRVLLIAGALRSTLELVAKHSSTRTQFGQPLARFQAVGQQIALLVEHVARAEMAAELATRWLEGSTDDDDLVVASITAREAATRGAAIAHQVHGAIGMAAEYDLQLLTRRLWTWRDEAGSELTWARRLGSRALAVGGEDLWTWTSR